MAGFVGEFSDAIPAKAGKCARLWVNRELVALECRNPVRTSRARITSEAPVLSMAQTVRGALAARAVAGWAQSVALKLC